MALFEYSKKKQALQDYGDEGKNYVVVLNSNEKVSGTNNNAQFYVDLSFLPKNFQYFKMNYSWQSSGGVYKDQILEFGGSTSGNTLTVSTYDTAITGQNCALNATLSTLMSNITYLQPNTYISDFQSGYGLLGTYTLSQAPTSDILALVATATLTSGSNVLTLSVARTGLLGMFVVHANGTTAGTRIIAGSGTTWYLNKPAISTHTNQTMNLYPAFQAKLNYSTANINIDFGCKSYIYDNANSSGISSYVGVAQRYNQGVASNHFNLWFEQMPSQILNIHNSTGVINTTIYNGDDRANGGNQLMTDISLGGIPTPDFSSWIATISFTPILSSHIDTQSF
jgi:hypothetical protein